MNTTTHNTRNDIALDLINLEPGETITFTAGRKPITVRRSGDFHIEGVKKAFAGHKAAANIVAALVRG